jgi:exodeoxyribonuclease VII large subunit
VALRSISVTQLSAYIKRLIAGDPILSGVIVKGEISKLTRHSSGHVYFTLKDSGSRISCFLPADRVPLLRYELEDGMEIIAIGSVSLYEKGGYYSLNVRSVEVEGEGALSAAFEALKRRLEAEGLFDPRHKKPLPPFPKRIGVVTSPTGAAIRDILTTLKRRYPFVDVLIYPCLVQGDGAAAQIAEGIKTLNERFPELDLMIVGRGGGSAEDLWCFNEEAVARAVYESEIPVISAVGHEIDTVICDLAADVRAATPTAAAELAVPHVLDLKDRVAQCSPERLSERLLSRISMAELRTEHALSAAYSAANDRIAALSARLLADLRSLEASDPLAVLARGFAYVTDTDGRHISSPEAAPEGTLLRVRFSGGEIGAVSRGAAEGAKEDDDEC